MKYTKGKIRLNIEIKLTDNEPDLVKMVAALIEQYDYIDECVVTSMNYEALKGIKQINPKIQTGYVLNVAYGNFYNLPYVDAFSINSGFVNKNMDYGDPGNSGYAYVVMCIDELVPQMKMLIVDGIVCIVLILIFTSGIFTTWIYKETVSPINKLKLATYNIKNGNLDFKMDVEGKDEIAELCRDFDSMRKRLLENAEDKIKIDNENKELIRNISHDLKTPITAIKGYVEGIMDGVVDTPEKMDRYVKTIYNKACDMDKLIDELTFYSKIDTDRVPYNFVCINLTDYFEDCVCLLYTSPSPRDTR